MENNQLGSSIAIMNAKGGVGKSTVTLAVAETLAYYYGKKVLVIDSDAQMSVSVMLMPVERLNQLRTVWKTLVGLLHRSLILEENVDWREFITEGVSDVDDVDSVHLLPGDLRLTLVERAVTEADRHEQMRGLVRSLLAEARLAYDFVLIDCPPGLSLLTEIWLREADFHLAPAKPDFLAIAGLEMFREFKKINPDLKMATNLGILINMKNSSSADDDRYHRILAEDGESRCFPQPVPHMMPIQHAARYRGNKRSYAAKYPGGAGAAFRTTVQEIISRIGTHAEVRSEARPSFNRPPKDDFRTSPLHSERRASERVDELEAAIRKAAGNDVPTDGGSENDLVFPEPLETGPFAAKPTAAPAPAAAPGLSPHPRPTVNSDQD